MDTEPLKELSTLVPAPSLFSLNGRSVTSVKAAYKYDRKEHDAFDDVAGPRNPSYGRSSDSIVCVVEFEAFSNTPLWYALKEAGDSIRKEELQRAVNEAQAKLDAATEALNALN